jgi:hypothetical protein
MIVWLLMLAAQAVATVELAERLGTLFGFVVFALLIASTMGLAGYLLHTSTTGEVTWRNRLAGLFLPWSLLAGQGSLSALLLKNLFASLAWGGLMIACYRLNWVLPSSPETKMPATVLTTVASWLAILCRLVLLAGWLLYLRSMYSRRLQSISLKATWQPLLIPPLAIVASLVLGHYGYVWLALLSVGLPLFIVLTPLLLMFAAMAYMTLTGKKIRWN